MHAVSSFQNFSDESTINGAHRIAVDYRPCGNSAASLDADDLDLLLLNLDASLDVQTRAQFFNWTQGLLQSLLPHHVLICVLKSEESSSYRIDCFSTTVPDPAKYGETILHDAADAPGLIRLWQQQRHQPLALDCSDTAIPLGASAIAALQQIGATWLLLHGSLNMNGDTQSLFLFGCEPGPDKLHERTVLRVIIPFLHAAWVRVQVEISECAMNAKVVKTPVLTDREREVLKWVYHGKSNAEIAAILDLSPLTIKNHVQKILRKLNVVNRAQAVGKALAARLIDV